MFSRFYRYALRLNIEAHVPHALFMFLYQLGALFLPVLHYARIAGPFRLGTGTARFALGLFLGGRWCAGCVHRRGGYVRH